MKILINADHGSFGLSAEAMVKLVKKKSELVEKTKYITQEENPYKSLIYKGLTKLKKVSGKYYQVVLDDETEQLVHQSEITDKKWVYRLKNDPAVRLDEQIIDTVISMGSSANGMFSNIEVVDVEDGADLDIIENRGGSETIKFASAEN